MSNGTNILILSAGTRDKVVQYFKRSLAGRGRVLATDMSEYAPAIYEADEHFIVPRMTDEGYLDVILEICRDYDVKGVLSLIDPSSPCSRRTQAVSRPWGPRSSDPPTTSVSSRSTSSRCSSGSPPTATAAHAPGWIAASSTEPTTVARSGSPCS